MPAAPPRSPLPIRARRDSVSGSVRALRLDDSEGGSVRERALRHRVLARLWPSAHGAPLAVTLPADTVASFEVASACDRALRQHGGGPESIWLDFEEADLARLPRADALIGLSRLKRRNWRLALRLAAGAPMALDREARALFSEMIAPWTLLPARLEPDHPLWIRLLAARACGIMTTLADAETAEPINFEFDLVEVALSASWEAQTPGARWSQRKETGLGR